MNRFASTTKVFGSSTRRKHVRYLWPWLLILLMLGSAGLMLKFTSDNAAMAKECSSNLKHIYLALELYEMEQGHLPVIEYYSDASGESVGSIIRVLQPYGIQKSRCICPKAPPVLREVGMSYVWNVNMNGGNLHGEAQPQWLLTEIEALSRKTPGPHFHKYQVLYTDGSVSLVSELPRGLEIGH